MKFLKKLLTCFHGFCMALADSVPGVSGGTVAFLLGFYDDFIGAIDALVFGAWDKKKSGFLYLIKIGIGWVIGFGLAVTILAGFFESGIYIVSSLFMGFIIFAIPVVVYMERECIKAGLRKIFWVIPGAALVVGITVLNGMNLFATDITAPTIGTYIYVFFAGAVAICAMVLPGISGSTLLLVFGLYVPVITAVKEIIHLNFAQLPIIIVFGVGIVAGICSIVKAIKVALEKHRAAMLYLIIGMMLGSMYSIVMGPTTLDVPREPMSFGTFNVIAFIIGGAVIAAMELARRYAEKKKIDAEKS